MNNLYFALEIKQCIYFEVYLSALCTSINDAYMDGVKLNSMICFWVYEKTLSLQLHRSVQTMPE